MQGPGDWNPPGAPGAPPPYHNGPSSYGGGYEPQGGRSGGYGGPQESYSGRGRDDRDSSHRGYGGSYGRDSDRYDRDRERGRYSRDGGRDGGRDRDSYRDRRRSRSRDGHRGRERDGRDTRDSRDGRDDKRRSKYSRSPSPEPYDPSQRKKTGWDVGPGAGVPAVAGVPILGAAPANRGDIFTPSRQAKRLYIGNLPPNISPFDLLNFMNAQFMAAGIFAANPGPPVVDTSVAHDGAYAFIELRTPQEATMAMAFDGLVFQGQALRVRRPKDYVAMPEDSLVPDVRVEGLDIVSTNVEDSPHKVFVGGLPAHLNEQDVKELLSLFGKLKAFNLVRDSHTSMSKGYAFCVYADAEKTDVACQSLNGMKIGDKTLVVQRASTNPRRLDGEGGEVVSGLNPMQKYTSSILNLSTPMPTIFAHLQASGIVPSSPEPSAVVVLLNMVDITEDFEDDYYNRVVADARAEAETYGALKAVYIPRPPLKTKNEVRRLIMPGTAEFEAMKKAEEAASHAAEVSIRDVLAKAEQTMMEMQTEEGARKRQEESEAALKLEEAEAREMSKHMLPSVNGLGKVFLHYESRESAVTAQREFAGRKYDGRMVITSFYPEADFIAEKF